MAGVLRPLVPVEVMSHMLTFVPIEDMHAVASVCKEWFSLLFRTEETYSPWRLFLARDFGIERKEDDNERSTWLDLYRNHIWYFLAVVFSRRT